MDKQCKLDELGIIQDLLKVDISLFDECNFFLKDHFDYYIKSCESPIEVKMSLSLYWKVYLVLNFTDCKTCFISPQHEIKINDKAYRVDFEIQMRRLNKNGEIEAYRKIIVECDGHEFHERTKEQAQKDKSRDRDLQSKGYVVLHFTGSEIWKDSDKCAQQVYDTIKNLIKEEGGKQ